MAELKEKLLSEFTPVSTEEWMVKITADLEGVPFEKKFVWETGEGSNVNPFYRAEDIEGLKTTEPLPGEFPYAHGTRKGNDWKVHQNIEVCCFKGASGKALDLLTEGVTSLGLIIRGGKVSEENIVTLLGGICPASVKLNFNTCNCRAEKLVDILTDYLGGKGVGAEKCYGSVNYDALKKPLIRGKENSEWVEGAAAVLKARQTLPNYHASVVNAFLSSNAGTCIPQELGYALAWSNELMAKLAEAGFTTDEVAKKIKLNFGISPNYFMEIAKSHTARWLWTKVVVAYKPACEYACKMVVHAQTSRWDMTIYDAHVNLLRFRTEAMSAALADVGSIMVRLFDKTYQVPDDFSRRIARSQQLLLKGECHLDKVVNPSADSYYVEVLMSSLVDVAWELFLEVEEGGGFSAAVNVGEIQNAVNTSNIAHREAVATRREILSGLNRYPNFTEVTAGKIQEKGSCCCDGGYCGEATIPALDFSRGAFGFEALHMVTERSGKIPRVFILTIGNSAMRLARSQFSASFFACAGYKVIDNLGFDTIGASVEATVKAGTEIMILCSNDDEYAEFAPAAYKVLVECAEFAVAGTSACTDDLKAQGIDQFVSMKSNVPETLKVFNAKLGIA